MPEIAELTIPLRLGGVERRMRFNLNTFAAYEDKTGRSFMEDAVKLYNVLQPLLPKEQRVDKSEPEAKSAPIDILTKIPMARLRDMLWASLHDYDKNDEPVWELTPGAVGKALDPAMLTGIFVAFISGNATNMPTKEVLGESQGSTGTESTSSRPNSNPEEKSEERPAPSVASGGTISTGLEPAFALPEESLAA